VLVLNPKPPIAFIWERSVYVMDRSMAVAARVLHRGDSFTDADVPAPGLQRIARFCQRRSLLMNSPIFLPARRRFLGTLAFGGAALFTPGAFAEELVRTPRQSEGPFYPDKLPLDTDNDLLIINDSITPAVGEVTHLSGRVLDARGDPVRNAVVEIWEADSKGVYIHTGSSAPNEKKRDANFQGFGRFLTGSSGEYYFRTIKPVAYSGRTAPHIHFKVKQGSKERLTTEMYVKGHPGNELDFIYKTLRGRKEREAVTVAFVPVKGSRAGELAARFDIVLGVTPGEG
jgi:protocatechuate 3,4-dioxygenase beta subunit